MVSNRKPAADVPPEGAGTSAAVDTREQTLDEVVKHEQDVARREKASRQDASAPRAGRTGGLGTRAERPSESRKPADPQRSGPRGGKPPAPKASK